MPPALEELEDSASEDLDTIPAKPITSKAAVPMKDEDEADDEEVADAVEGGEETKQEEEDDDDDEGDDEEAYVVESITKHEWDADSGVVIYQVKWLGYEKAADRTWEPESNLSEGASEILKAYWKKIGGKPEPKQKAVNNAAKSKRKRMETETPTDTPPAPNKRGRKPNATNGSRETPPGASWEETVNIIETIEQVQEVDVKGKKVQSLKAYVVFNNGHKALSRMNIVRQNCPQKLIDYYERHLYVKGAKAFVSSDDAAANM